MGRTPTPEPSGVITVMSDVAPDGRTYIATVQLDGDTARTLNRDEGYAWAAASRTAAAHAEHDSLVIRQLHRVVELPLGLAISCVAALRADRPPLDDKAIAPMRLTPGVNKQGEPFIGVHINGVQVGQWTCEDARSHAAGVFEVMAAVDLDAAYCQYLVESIGVESGRARNIVGSLAELRGEQQGGQA